jgi:plastocyanin
MNKQNFLSILSILALLSLCGCGEKKTEVSEQPSQPAQPTPGVPVDAATVGQITGKVMFDGTKPKLARIMMDQDPVCVGKHKTPAYAEDGEVNSNGTLPNVFVYVKEGADKYSFQTPSEPVVLDQDGCMYKPHVLGVLTGQELIIVSSDPTTHNIHPMPKDNREWNESQPPGAAPLVKTFARPEVMIPVKCNQHPWMRAYIGVTKNPLYAVTGNDGTFTLKGVPPGDYTLEAWTVMGGGGGQTQDQKVAVAAKETKTVNFTFKAS